MDPAEINNWKTIAESMEAKGDMESWFYLRARDRRWQARPNAQRVGTDGWQFSVAVTNTVTQGSPADLVRLGPCGAWGPGD